MIVLAGFVSALSVSNLHAAETDFYRDVYPFLKANCISCHNKTTTKAGLNMETPELMIKGGDSGPSIVPGDSEKSILVEASIHTDDMEMPPPKNKTGAVNLTKAEIATLRRWIDEGAKSSVQDTRKVVWQPLAAGVDPIYTVSMTADGHLAACGRSNQISLYDLTTRSLVGQITDPNEASGGAHRALVNSLAFSPDGSRLASGSFREVKIWKREQTSASHRKEDPALKLETSVLSTDGTIIVGLDSAGAILILDAGKGSVLRKIEKAASGSSALLSLSPDASKVAVFSQNWNLSVWDLKDGKLLLTRLSPDPGLEKNLTDAHARLAAATGVDKVTLSKAVVEAQQKLDAAKKVPVQALAWTGDGEALATGSDDKLLRLWPLAPAESAPRVLKGSHGAITVLAPGATPDEIVSASAENKVRIWSLSKGAAVKEIAASGVVSLSTSPDGNQLATGGSDGVVRLWDIATGKQSLELRMSVEAAKQIADLEWEIAAQTLEQAVQKAIVTEVESQTKALDELLKKADDAIALSTKNLPLREKEVKPKEAARLAAQTVVDEAAAALAKATAENKPDPKLDAALKAAQDKLITAQTAEADAIAAVNAEKSNATDAEATKQRITETKAGNTTEIAEANAAAEASKAAHAKATTDLAAAKKAVIGKKEALLAVKFSTDSRLVAASFGDGSIRTWAALSGTPLAEAVGNETSTASLIVESSGAFASVQSNGALTKTQSTPSWKLERVLGGVDDATLFPDRVNAVAFSPDGKTLATGSGEPSRTGDITLFALDSGKLITAWAERHTDSVVSLDFSPDGKLLASGAADKIARVTEVATGEESHLFEGHTHYVTDVAFRADGRILATAGADGVVNAWDMISGERKKKIEGWKKEVTSLQFIGATNQLVTSAGDNLIRVVRDDGGQVRSISKLPDFMQAAASTPDGSILIGGGEDSYLRVWNGADGKELAAFGMQ